MNKTILLTGGAGFIGTHVTDELIKLGHNVVVLDDLSGGFEDNINPKAKFVKGTITKAALINKLFEQHKFSHVYHLAAYAAEGLSHFIRHFNYENNLLGSVNLINASINHNIECFVFTSSIAVYGAGQVPMLESTQPMPEDPYGIAKFAVEMDLRAAHEMFGLNYVIFRPHNVYGEKQNIGDKYRNVIGIFMNQIMQGEPLTVFGDGEQQRAFSYIGDLAPVIAAAGFEPRAFGEIFNIGADKPYTVNQLAKTIMVAMGKQVSMNYLLPRNEVKNAYSDHSKAKEVFGQRQATNLETGIKKMAEWALMHGPRESKKFQNIEIPKNLPPNWLDQK